MLTALKYTDARIQMPPGGKLADSVIADFERWIAEGAVDPRVETATASAALKGMSIEEGRKLWAFQPVREIPAPSVRNASWPKSKIDSFLLAAMERKNLAPSPAADKRTLARRAYIDLTGLKPTYEEVEQFAADASPEAYAKLVDKLLASPRYGERWARHWLDVARYGEDNSTSEATNPAYRFAWRYRDWVIEAINNDVPYDRFVKLQLAADQMGAPRNDLRALGYLGAAPIYHKDQRLSEEVIHGFLTDDWDERVDAVTRGLLGLTVACARCHDHKFDPIPTKDYYGLAGVFASTMRAERPMFNIDPKLELRYLWAQNRLFDLRYSANLLTNEASTVEGSAERVVKWRAEIEKLRAEFEPLRGDYPLLVGSLDKYWTPPPKGGGRREPSVSTDGFMNAVYDAAQYVDGSDAQYTWVIYKPGEARDVPVLRAGNVSAPGEIAPRHFLAVLSKSEAPLQRGSGRLDLAERLFTDAAPLAARVIVNRVWGWHFGRPLAGTPSDFGTQGEKPTHPELLDDLSARFVANGWSLKWLHREIMLSAAYRQSSAPRADAAAVDQENTLLWRMNPRRVDFETFRDSILRASDNLDETMYGPSYELDEDAPNRRTVYARVSRGRQNKLMKMYDFPDPTQTSPGRDLTITALQQLFVMNSAFMKDQAARLVKSAEDLPDTAAKVRRLYRRILARDPSEKELALASAYEGGLEQYAQILLATNEEIFWP
jgi:hypothetical protein